MTPRELAGARFGGLLTANAVAMIRELRECGVTDTKEIVVQVASEIVYIGARFVRAAGVNRATLDAVVLRAFDEVYAEPDVDDVFAAELRQVAPWA